VTLTLVSKMPDTPPHSPCGLSHNPEDQDELGELQEGDALEVIDLDDVMEAQGGEDMEEDEGENEDLPEDNSKHIFTKHEKAVFTCDAHPRFPGVYASGGEDDLAYVWQSGSEDTALFQTKFKDSVVFARYNRDGALLALADMAGNVRVHRVVSQSEVQKDPVWEFETSDVTWMEWHPGANVLFVTTDDGQLWMWKIPSGDSKIYTGSGEKAEGAVVMPDGKRVAVGYGDGSVRIFDLKSGDVAHALTDATTSHSPSPVTAMTARDNLLATGGSDGLVKIFNVQSGKNIGTFVHGHSRNAEPAGAAGGSGENVDKSTVESLLFSQSEQGLLVAGTLDGYVTVWDVSSHVKRHAVSVGDGVVKMAWRKGDGERMHQVLVATLHGKVSIVDVRTGKVLGQCSGHTLPVLDMAQTSDGNHVLSCSDDSDCRIFDVDKVISGADS